MQLKAHMGDRAKTMNLVFSVNPEELADAEIFNGYENVAVKVAVLGESHEEKPARIGEKKAEQAAE